MNTTGWQPEWPTEPGTWWYFYGWRYGRRGRNKPKLWVAYVVDDGWINFFSDGHPFMGFKERVRGVWQRMTPPELPKEEPSSE